MPKDFLAGSASFAFKRRIFFTGSSAERRERPHELSNVPDLLDRLDQLERATDALRGEHEARAVGELLVQLRARERTVRSTAIAFVRRLRQLAAVDQIHLDEAAHLVEAA